VEKYNPKDEYFKRMNPVQKAGIKRRQQSPFSDSMGGDSSNYEEEPNFKDSRDAKKPKRSWDRSSKYEDD
jgi:hypothetical protein